MKKLSWKTEKRLVKDLIPYEKNPRRITKFQKQKLTESLEQFDLVEIPAIDTDNKIIAGHQRIKVLSLLGHKDKKIDVRVPNRKLTDEEFKKYNLISNKIKGEWDEDLLSDYNSDFLSASGFESEEIDKILGMGDVEEDDFDAGKEYEKIKEPKAKLGDIYQLGSHRLMCGNSTNKDDFKKLMGNKKVKLCFTSPPYNMGAKMYENYKDNLKSEEYIKFNLKVIENVKEYLRGFIFWNISYNKNSRWEFIEIFYRIIKETGLKFLELIVWNKKHAMPINSKKMLTRQYEDILVIGDEEAIQEDLELFFVGKNNKEVFFNKKTQQGITNYWEINVNRVQLDSIQTCYPVELPFKGIMLMTDENDIVMDPFIGSGSTLIACEQSNRICMGLEIDPIYIDVIIKRFEKFTGKKAKKL